MSHSQQNNRYGVDDDNGEFTRQSSKESAFSGMKIESSPSVEHYVKEIKFGGYTLREAEIETVSHISICFLIYAALLMVWKCHYWLPFDSGFALASLWFAGMGMGRLFKLCGLPQLLGMLVAGILLKNCGDMTRNLPDAWGDFIRSFGLINILMRGGLEMDLGAVRRLGMAVVRLTVCPGVCEAVSVGFLAQFIFGMPFFLSLSFGFILAAVSPAVVVGGMFDLQNRGYGIKKGIPAYIVAAASFDDVVAISGFSMFIGLAIGGGDILKDAIGGPINVFGGGACGFLGAIILSMTKLWNCSWKRACVIIELGIIFKFCFKMFHFDGAGALAAIVMAAAAAQFWENGWAPFGMSAGKDSEAAHECEQDLCVVWRLLSEPLLFSVIGQALDFSKIEPATIPKSVVLLICCVGVRTVAAFLSTYGCNLSMRERQFIALAWMPKATVQAALGSVPLAMVHHNMKDSPDFEQFEKWGNDIVATAVFSILLTAPAGLIVIQKLGPRWLTCDEGPEMKNPVQLAMAGNIASATMQLSKAVEECEDTDQNHGQRRH
jgi:NhaP-type Na+/H+ or K+/H+ antiporter